MTLPGVPDLPLGPLAEIPVIGPMFFQLDIMVYLAILLIPATWWVLNRTKLGLMIQ